ncbi:MAG: hypothetical protein NC218_02250 [Acetobacter sp.]|nr:hypothetical protein [Acetobacter sp.]
MANRGPHNGLEFEDDIALLELPKGITKHLRAAGIQTIRELCTYTESNITSIKYIGYEAKMEIIFTLAHYDFRLGDPK